ncbi:sensor histidine kinase [Pseudogemmobacter sp. W21_MBD1_M6]|uniref:sensor histidine kinase n=1 Tax=Pseudogemmobacter sp. W21_MBD1_M6 TaxID=3240271 RepID=UPI003F98AA35
MIAPDSRRIWRLTLGVLLGAMFGAGMIMLLLGSYLIREYRDMQVQNAAESGGLYVEGFLTPHAHEFFASGTLSDHSKAKLELLLARLPVAGHFEVMKIWDKNMQMIFSTDGYVEDEDEYPLDLKKALDGEIVVEVFADNDDHADAPIAPPYLEIHAPIYDVTNREIIAVGEVYQDATGFFRQRAVVEGSIWLALGLSSAIGLAGILALVATQRRTDLRHLAAVSAIAGQNRMLREEADQARIEASRTNEQLLNQIGAELHDGPIQMLSLMMLTLGKDAAQNGMAPRLTARELGTHVMQELRAISTGLVLPEIRDLSLEETLRLAVNRHEAFTGNTVAVALGDLPEQVDQGLKICCFRLVQEGLMNAHRHADGLGQRVTAAVSDNTLSVTISDEGRADRQAAEDGDGRVDGVGLRGVRQRLNVFRGTLDIRRKTAGGTELTARIPLS